MPVLPKILVCDDDTSLQGALKLLLGRHYHVWSAYTAEESLDYFRRHRFDLVIMDLNLAAPRAGLMILPKLIEMQPDVQIVFFSGVTDFDVVREAIKLGVMDYVPKSAGSEEILLAVQRSIERKQLKNRQKQKDAEIYTRDKHLSLIGQSPKIEKLRKIIERVKNTDCSICIQGETGCGKEIVARTLRRTLKDGSLEPFVSVDSSTIQTSVAESLLFGYEKGAFTGAEKTTRGLFEEANGGTIYFDEIGNMPIEIQNKLLRVLQEKEVLRLGSSRPIQLEFRVISATSSNLEKAVESDKFREDLYQRLNVIQIDIPPLRERKEDIPSLISHFSNQSGHAGRVFRFSPEVMDVLLDYPFPGNVRELQNLIRYLDTLCDSDEVTLGDLPPKIQKHVFKQDSSDLTGNPISYYQELEVFEKNLLKREYLRFEGSVSKMAAGLNLDRSNLFMKLRNYGIHTPSKRNLDTRKDH